MTKMYDQIARYYDLTHAGLTADIPFVLALAARAQGPVLELGCGSGRLLFPLAHAGHTVVGLDNAPAMLARAQARLAAESAAVQERIQLVEADMTAFSLPDQHGRFALAILPYNTFLHLDSTQKTAALIRIQRHLALDGRLFIDLINPAAIAQTTNEHVLSLENSFTDPETGHTVLQMASSHLDDSAQILHITWIYDATPPAGGPIQRTIATAVYHYLYPHQMELLLKNTGFKLASFSGSYDHAPFHEESERLLIEAAVALSGHRDWEIM